jgi:glycosyltransferase 2 family protein
VRRLRGAFGVRPAVVGLGLVVSVGFAYVAVRRARLDEVWAALAESDYAWIAPGLAALAAWFFMRAERWRSLFAAARRPPLRAAASALFVGYLFNNILPARAGEAARIVALNRRAGAPLAETTATVVIERIFDVLSLLLLLFVGLPWLPDLAWIRAAALFGAVLVLALAAAILILARFRERPLRFVFRQLGRLPGVSEDRLQQAPANFVHGLLGLRDVRTALVAFAWTTASWIVLGVGFWSVMLAFDLGLSPLAGELVVIGVGLALILPSSPAALGVFEGATVIVLSAYGVSDSRALSYALVLHALNLLPFLVPAPLLLRPYGGLLRRARAPDRGARAADAET